MKFFVIEFISFFPLLCFFASYAHFILHYYDKVRICVVCVYVFLCIYFSFFFFSLSKEKLFSYFSVLFSFIKNRYSAECYYFMLERECFPFISLLFTVSLIRFGFLHGSERKKNGSKQDKKNKKVREKHTCDEWQWNWYSVRRIFSFTQFLFRSGCLVAFLILLLQLQPHKRKL